MRRFWGLIALLLLVVAAVPSADAADPRLREFVLRTGHVDRPVPVRVLLPKGYDGQRRYPVLYLLHGGVDDYRSWVDKGQAAELTASYPLIVVMPDAGQGGWYSDWYNYGSGGPPQWESFHMGQLIRWVDSHFATIRNRSGRALAGLSMGGFGAMSYAARHPDLFVAAASYSGAVDTVHASPGTVDLVIDATVLSDGGLPESVWGPRATEETRWKGHNPWDLGENLRGLELVLRTGNGMTDNGIDPIERGVHAMSTSLHERLAALRIPHLWEDYGAGGHTWDRWAQGLQKTLPIFMRTFANPPPAPRRVSFVAVEPSFGVYGWNVRFNRSSVEMARLSAADVSGFRLAGRGDAVVTTPAAYEPGSRHIVTVGSRSSTVAADRRGRLRIPVSFGSSTPLDGPTEVAVRIR